MDRLLLAAPVALIVSYLTFTIALFSFGPMPWPVTNPGALSIFLTTVIAGVCAFYLLGVKGEPSGKPINIWRQMIVGGAMLSTAILFPSCYYFADKMPWQILDALRDQNAVYQALQAKLAATTSSERTLISLARALSYPITFAVLPLAVLNWQRMNWWLWALALAAVSSNILFSILRGTDREMFDIIIILGASGMVAAGRYCAAGQVSLSRLLKGRTVIIAIMAFLVLGAIAFSVFADRRVQRSGYTPEAYAAGLRDAPSLAEHLRRPQDWFDVMCIRAVVCLDPEHPLVRYVDVPKKYTIFWLTGYLTQGWYGLSLAMKQDFHSTFGIGHGPVVTRLYGRLTGDTSLYKRSYTYGLRQMNWHDESQWSTIFPWLANDVGFYGAVAVICLLAFLFGRSWRDAVGAENDAAAITFCLLFQLFTYAPANNQLANTLDGYLAIVGWCSFWLLAKLQSKRKAARQGLSHAK